MLAAYAVAQDPHDPLAGLAVGERPEPEPAAGWEVVEMRAATVNRHDLFSLMGRPLAPERLPMILGTDVAGVTADGREVVAHAVLGDRAGRWTLPSEEVPGTLAERVALPAANLIDKPPELTFAEAACLPTAYLTAYRMLFTHGGVRPGDRVLVQGAAGGVASAAIVLARAAGAEVAATSRSAAGRALAARLGAARCVAPGERLPARVDVVIETVGAATWRHSLNSVRNGGRVVVAGATTGADVTSDLQRLFLREVSVLGTSMGTADELAALVRFLVATGARPVIDSARPLADARSALARMHAGTVAGKLVLTP